MAEPENHTIRLIQEMREELRTTLGDMRRDFTRLDAKMNDGFEHLSDEIEEVRKVLAGRRCSAAWRRSRSTIDWPTSNDGWP